MAAGAAGGFITRALESTLKKCSNKKRVMKGQRVGEYVQKNAPAFCHVDVVGEEGKKITKGQVVQLKGNGNPSPGVHSRSQPVIAKQFNRNLFEWMCFSPMQSE